MSKDGPFVHTAYVNGVTLSYAYIPETAVNVQGIHVMSQHRTHEQPPSPIPEVDSTRSISTPLLSSLHFRAESLVFRCGNIGAMSLGVK
jgi:hypothetical protein